MRRGGAAAAAAACGAWMLLGVAPAWGAYRAEAPRLVSGPVAPPGLACTAPRPPRTSDQSVAVDPRDPNHLVAAWMQDRFGADALGSQGLGVAVSRDGGKSWAAARVRGLTGCDGGPGLQGAVNEAQVAIGYDGTVYVTGDLYRGAARLPYVIRSVNGGASFGAPSILNSSDRFAGQEGVTVDPLRHEHAYVSWHRVEPSPLGALFATSVLYMSHTADGGASWSPPREVRRPGAGRYAVASHILRPRDGSLVDVFAEQSASNVSGQTFRIPLRSVRSTDDGASWSAPVDIGSIEAGATFDPEGGKVVNRFPTPSTAQAPDGTLYVAWRNGTNTAGSRIEVARSRDGGRSWTRAAPAAVLGTQSFLPQIAVSRTGAVGVSYYDFRGDRPGDGELTTRVWMATSVDRGGSWREMPLAGPFDARPTLAGDSSFIGDTAGLAGSRHGFVATFNLGAPLARRGVTDLFSSRVERCSVVPSAAACDPPLRVRGLRVRPNPIPRRRRGRIAFRLSRPAGVSVQVELRGAGTRRGKRCAAPRPRGRRCVRFRRKAVLSRDGRAGSNSIGFSTRRLPKGSYRARVRAVDAIGVRSPERRVSFRIR